jgi:predicted GH43/DUF377 family glycosyl hydrolase
MVSLRRYPQNPLLSPDPKHHWEQTAVFNGCPVTGDDGSHMLYRAISTPVKIGRHTLELSSIGHAISFDRITFLNRRQLIKPQYEWEQFGCEDPRVTRIGSDYYIFYTAVSTWPPSPAGIAAAYAKTNDFRTISEKHLITPFNAKAMTLFPEKIQNKYAVLLTANSDLPPSTIGIAYLDSLDDLTDIRFWEQWYNTLPHHAIPLLRSHHDHVEIGAPPLKTKEGWLLIYSYIKNYLSAYKFFGIEAVLLDIKNPQIILGRTAHPILYPETEYERVGLIPDIVFPSGALIHNDNLGVYYGAADMRVCLATCNLDELLRDIVKRKG